MLLIARNQKFARTVRVSADAHPHGRVAFLPLVSITLKALKPKETDFEPSCLGEHLRKRRLELQVSQKGSRSHARSELANCLQLGEWEDQAGRGVHPGDYRVLGSRPFRERSQSLRPTRCGAAYKGLDDQTGSRAAWRRRRRFWRH